MKLRTWLERLPEPVEHIIVYDYKPWEDNDPPEVLYEGPLKGLPKETLDREFDDGYGSNEGPDFHAWTKSYVVFPTNYDGAEWTHLVPRNPTRAENYVRPGGG